MELGRIHAKLGRIVQHRVNRLDYMYLVAEYADFFFRQKKGVLISSGGLVHEEILCTPSVP